MITSVFALVLLLCLGGCRKPSTEAPASPSPAQPAATPKTEAAEADLSAVAIQVLNRAHRGGAVILRGQCGAHGIDEAYRLQTPVTLEPMDQALQAISGNHQNIYWRESPASGVRLVDSKAQATLLRVRVREFRVVEDREPDAVMAVLWKTPEVAAFLRSHHLRFTRRAYGAGKALSPPMILQMKNAPVADILDRIAAGYHSATPKVWVYHECEAAPEKPTAPEKKEKSGKRQQRETLVDVQMK